MLPKRRRGIIIIDPAAAGLEDDIFYIYSQHQVINKINSIVRFRIEYAVIMS